MADEELVASYRRILQAGYEAARGQAYAPELEEAARLSVVGAAERLAEQLERSILDAPWLRTEVLQIVEDWMGKAEDLDFGQLRGELEAVFGPSRALTIARSETAGAYNGAMAATLRAHGFDRVVWIAAPDACPECEALDGQVLGLTEYEAEPTLHPNSVLSGSTFASCGPLLRMIRAAYRGPAVRLATSDGSELTIGPNHPMLTVGGLVRAKQLEIGDQLIYDSRAEGLSPLNLPDFQQVQATEQVFRALQAIGGLTRIAATGMDFHGDVMFFEEKVEVVFPERGLLKVLETLGIEQLRYCQLTLADADAPHVARCRSCKLAYERVFAAAACGVGRADVIEAPVFAEGSFEHLNLLTVKDTRIVPFEGEAFDASTESGFYLSNGFVVSNCSCTAEPYVEEEEEEAEA